MNKLVPVTSHCGRSRNLEFTITITSSSNCAFNFYNRPTCEDSFIGIAEKFDGNFFQILREILLNCSVLA